MSSAGREHQRPAPVSDGGSAKKKPHERLPDLIALANQQTNPEDQRRFTVDVIEALVAMRAPGDEAEECRILIAHLEAKTLHQLRDSQGRSTHQEAVETLLSLGFPHALQVNPEDLDQYRNGSVGLELAERVSARHQASVVAFVSQAAGIAYWAYAQPTAALWWLTGSVVLGLSAGWMLRAMMPRDATVLPMTLLALSTMAAFGAGMAAAPLFVLFGGMLLSTLIVRKAETDSKERED